MRRAPAAVTSITTTAPTTTATTTPTAAEALGGALAPPGLLRLLWLASPALPVGGFSYSEGLEAAVEAGRVRDEASATRWLVEQLELVLARAELPLVAAAFAAWRAHDVPRLAALNAWSHATRESAELRAQSEQMGRALLAWLRHDAAPEPAGGDGDARIETLASLAPVPTWPLAFGLAAARADASVQAGHAVLACAFAWAENATQAAMKAVPLGQAAAQRMLAALTREIPSAVTAALARGEADWQAFAPMHAILSSRHETQYSRLFRS